MLRITNTTVAKEEDATITQHTVEGTVTLAMDSFWDYEGPQTVNIESITLIEEDDYTMVNVVHDTTWNIYTDSGFEQAISELLGFEVMFTEQGMQDDGFASMEV